SAVRSGRARRRARRSRALLRSCADAASRCRARARTPRGRARASSREFCGCRRSPSSKGNQVAWEAREQLAAALGHQHIVFDAYAAESWNVRARLNGEDHAGGEGDRRHIRARLADARLFVNIEAESVAGAVTERITKPAAAQQIARRRIYGRRVDSG